MFDVTKLVENKYEVRKRELHHIWTGCQQKGVGSKTWFRCVVSVFIVDNYSSAGWRQEEEVDIC